MRLQTRWRQEEEEQEQEEAQEGERPVRRQRLSLQSLKQLGQMSPPLQMPSDIHCMVIIGQIEGHMLLPAKNKTTKYEHLIPQLVAIEQNPHIRGLLILLNTVGGDVEAGLAIAARIGFQPVSWFWAAGIDCVPMPLPPIIRLLPRRDVTIHPLRLSGMLIGPQTYEYLEKMQDRVIKFITGHSRISEERLRNLCLKPAISCVMWGRCWWGKMRSRKGSLMMSAVSAARSGNCRN